MKKIMVLSVMTVLCSTTSFAEPAFTPSMINDIQTFQGINTHDMNSFRQQQFRYEEINDAKDLKEQKEKLNNRNRDVVNEGPMIFQAKPQKDINFVEENGEIKIDGPDAVMPQPVQQPQVQPQQVSEEPAQPAETAEPQNPQQEIQEEPQPLPQAEDVPVDNSKQLQPNAEPENPAN